MKKWMCFLLLFPLLGSLISTGAHAQGDEKILWIENETTIDATKLNGKPGMLYFYAGLGTTSSLGTKVEAKSSEDRDVPRLGLPERTLNNRDVVALSKKFLCFEFNLDYDPQVVTQYGVIGYPNVIFTDPWGNEICRCVGMASAERLISFMEIFPEDYSDVLSWKKVLEKDSKDFEALNGLGEFYQNLEAWEKSNEFYNMAFQTKFVRENEDELEAIILVIGLNELRMRNFKEAQKLFERCLAAVTKGKNRDKTLLGLIIAQLGQDKIYGAERNLRKLKSQFPDSPAVDQALRYIQSVKASRK